MSTFCVEIRQIGLPAYIENAFELLDQPGEWYLDPRARMVFYIPRPGEDMLKLEVIEQSERAVWRKFFETPWDQP